MQEKFLKDQPLQVQNDFDSTPLFQVEDELLPEIIIPNLLMPNFERSKEYRHIIRHILKKLIQPDFYKCNTDAEKIQCIKNQFPFVSWEYQKVLPSTLAIHCIYNYRLYSSKFIYDIISRWLIPGKRLNILSSFGSDFAFKKNPNERFILVEMLLNIDNSVDLNTIKKTLPMVAAEIQVGVTSISQGMRILEIKGLNVDDKINLIQESVVSLMNQKPDHFDRNLFIEMQHFFVFSQESFKELREYRHIVRIICWQYLFRKSMKQTNQSGSSKRLVRAKLMKTRLHYPYGAKTVLGVLIGVNQIKENERFGQQQIIKTIQGYIPEAQLVSNSFIANKKTDDEGVMIYAEFDKKDNKPFTFEELSKLRTILPEDLRGRIEQFMHPVFMPRNEEEVMRNILNLSKQLKGYDDIPQIIITFDSQSANHILFSIVLLRVVKNDDESVQDICSQNKFKYEFIPDRIKIVGHVKKKYVKEANVFYVRLEKQSFLRKDHSLDLYKARQSLLNELYRVFEDVRDYNGGMIAKENEVFVSLKESLKENGPLNELVLENFFYSINPVIIRSMIDPKLLETSYGILQSLLADSVPIREGHILKFCYQSKYLFAYVVAQNPSFEKNVNKALSGLKLARFQLISTFIQLEDTFYLGLIFHSERIEERKRFCDVLRKSLELWEANKMKMDSF